MIVLLKIIVFIVLLTLIVYQKYYYFAACTVVVICVSVYLFIRPEGIVSVTNPAVSAARRFDKDELTTGVPLVKEGFSIMMPKIIMGDDSGMDYHRSNKFVEEDSRDFTDKYFNSKKCGIGSGIGGITMFGSNELIGGSRNAALSGVYNFGTYYVTNDSSGNAGSRYKYFKDCVFEPVSRSMNSGGGDFRNIKTAIFKNVNNNIININGILARFDKTILFNTYNDPNADYSKRISLSSKDGNDRDLTTPTPASNTAYISLIVGDDNQRKLKNIQPISNDDNLTDKMYADLLTTINNNSATAMNSIVRQRHLEIYAKAYGFRKRLDSIFANMRVQTKDDASLMYTVRISESVVQELRMMLGYLAIIQRTNDIIMFELNNGASNQSIYNMVPTDLTASGSLGPISSANTSYPKSKISGDNNIFKIPLEDDTYNNNDEKRYVYGITYYFDKANSTPTGA